MAATRQPQLGRFSQTYGQFAVPEIDPEDAINYAGKVSEGEQH